MDISGRAIIPSDLTSKAITIKNDPIIYAWSYPNIKELAFWIKANNYSILRVKAIPIDFGPPQFYSGHDFESSQLSWTYERNRNLPHENSKMKNFSEALKFIESTYAENGQNVVFVMQFDTENELNNVEKEFYEKGVYNFREIYLSDDDAIDMIKRYREKQQEISAIEAFCIEGRYIQPVGEILYDLGDQQSGPINEKDKGHWIDAEKWLREVTSKGWLFVISAS
jgi:hypothetical protein